MVFNLAAHSVHGILLDIEGTTTPIHFVYQVLFPFARVHLGDYLRRNFDSEDLQRDLQMLREEHSKDLQQEAAPPEWLDEPVGKRVESVVRYVLWLMDRDRKSTGLKALQGRIWQEGYTRRELKSKVFADLPPALERWNRNKLDVRIFSSGSVLAQKLLFAHTEAGDLTGWLHGYFDTTVGPKTAAESYQSIAEEFHLSPPQVLFISDAVAELDAAKRAGLQTLLCVRPDNPRSSGPHVHAVIRSFDEIVA